MDLKHYDIEAAAERGIEVHVNHPVMGPMFDEDGQPLIIVIKGCESATWKAKAKEMKAARATDEKPEDLTEEVFLHAAKHCLAACTLEFKGRFEWDGKPLKACYEDALTLYQGEGFLWLVNSLLHAAGDNQRLFFGQPNA